MSGAKGSLNVAVAFGILMYAWTSSRPLQASPTFGLTDPLPQLYTYVH